MNTWESERDRRVYRAMIYWAFICLVMAHTWAWSAPPEDGGPLRLATFEVDASPPIGSPLAYDPTQKVALPLSCRGIVLLGSGKPMVLCAVDWLGISNGSYRDFRAHLARAARTTVERVAVHTLHQHDAPRCDFSAEEMLLAAGARGIPSDAVFGRDVLQRAAGALEKAIDTAQPVTHVSFGQGQVEQVASNRRILGPNGKVIHVRWSATKDPVVRAFPEGVIDPQCKLVAFWKGDKPLAALTYYATHPQSYYRTGQANPDFPGLARNQRQKETGVFHVHFCGAAGNVTAGKYNDGAVANRQILADRVAAGMRRAWENARKVPIAATDVAWQVEGVALPVARDLQEKILAARVQNEKASAMERHNAASALVWLRRCQTGDKIDISVLKLGPARVLHLPGELFVEYQLAAQAMRPDLFVTMAAYGEYAPWYIGTDISYTQGGYETGPGVSLVGPGVETVLHGALRRLLAAPDGKP